MANVTGCDDVRITHVEVRDFRCFSRFEVDLNRPVTIIDGANGSGKTSLLEAIYYSCYLRSFRSGAPKELIRFGQDSFFMGINTERVSCDIRTQHRLQVGFSEGKRLVKADGKRIGTYKELIDHLRVVCLTEDDLELIKGGPQARRLFLDHALLLQNPEYGGRLRAFRQIVNNRNALLRANWQRDIYTVLTEQMWRASHEIEEARIALLNELSACLNNALATYFPQAGQIKLCYKSTAGGHQIFENFQHSIATIMQQERRFYRSVFGAHLDDFSIEFGEKKARLFASRGQQKLMTMLFKLAQIELVCRVTKTKPAFLVDDFMTDFDESVAKKLILALHNVGLQLIFTSPTTEGFLSNTLLDMGAACIRMTN